MRKFYLLIVCQFFVLTLYSQSILRNISSESIGPAIMSGRVVDLDVNPKNPSEFYVGYASGGLWYTQNNGTTFEPVMDNSPTQNIGDIAVDWNKGTIWVGTGEVNASRSSYAGIGIIRSEDKGKTWENMGLPDSHHVSRILINPENPSEVLVGVIGHLYTPNNERGIFRTSDGGKTWVKTLFINDQTGIIDLEMVPGNFDTLYAAAWQRERKAWDFVGSGDNSGIYKSSDGGKTWSEISTQGSGFLNGSGKGRIGLAVFDENTVYAIVDNQDRRTKKEDEKKDPEKLYPENFEKLDALAFSKLDDKKLNRFLKDNDFPKKYDAAKVKMMVDKKIISPDELSKYLKNANNDLFDTPVVGAEVYRSDNGGNTWQKTHQNYIDDLYYSYGYYFGRIHVHPKKKDKIYIYGVPLLTSDDGGKTFRSIDGDNVHADHHDLWINPNSEGHLINGNDGGVNITYDDGKSWIKNNQPNVGQFYSVNVDHQKPYNVYGGLQDNGVWKGPNDYKTSTRWQQSGKYPYESLMGGDGMQVQIDPRNDSILYTGFQFGYYYRINTQTGKRKFIQPKHDLGELPLRFNWQTPILLSNHNADILYLGSNKLHRSMNRGEDFQEISGDLTQGGKKGNVPYGTISTLSESPFSFGLIYVGTDDGLVHITKNGGETWLNVSENLPKNLWLSRVIASNHKKERVYVSLNGYRNDDFKPYLFVSENYGSTWQPIHGNLPHSPINVVKEDSVDEQILYLGNDEGVFVSFDKGNSWEILENGMPKVAVHDLVVQPEAKDLVIGTHGRSLYKTDIKYLQRFNQIKNKDLEILGLEDGRFSANWGERPYAWGEIREPEFQIPVYSSQSIKQRVNIKSENGVVVNSFDVDLEKGFNYEKYDLSFSENGLKNYLKKDKLASVKAKSNGKSYLPKGKYFVEIGDVSDEFEIK